MFKGVSPLPSLRRPALPLAPDRPRCCSRSERAFLQSVGAILVIISDKTMTGEWPEGATAHRGLQPFGGLGLLILTLYNGSTLLSISANLNKNEAGQALFSNVDSAIIR